MRVPSVNLTAINIEFGSGDYTIHLTYVVMVVLLILKLKFL